jgi:riboflavin synthase
MEVALLFTGLVEAKGRLTAVKPSDAGVSITVASALGRELSVGDSVALNGVCLTVTRRADGEFTVDVVPQTLGLTSLGKARPGTLVNLERALRLGDRFGGHMVTGHVDGRGTVLGMTRSGNGTRLVIELDEQLLRHVVARGSIAVDGMSLTVASVEGRAVTVALIPETLRATVADGYRKGSQVNIETDILAKHIERLLEARTKPAASAAANDREGLTMERLRDLGLVE